MATLENNAEEKKTVPSESEKIVQQMEGLSPEELEELKKKLQRIKKDKLEKREQEREYSDEELKFRFQYIIFRLREDWKMAILPMIMVILTTLTFLVFWIVQKQDGLAYGFGFSAIFVAGLVYYVISTNREIKRLEEAAKDPRANLHLVEHQKRWYELEFESLSDEEKEAALERVKSYSRIFARHKKKK